VKTPLCVDIVCLSVRLSVPALTFERFNFSHFCLRIRTYRVRRQIKFEDDLSMTFPWPSNRGQRSPKVKLSLRRYYMFLGSGITINDIILTSDLSLTFKSRSKVTKGQVEFKTLLYVFRVGDHDKRHHFDLWPFLDLQIEVKGHQRSSWV